MAEPKRYRPARPEDALYLAPRLRDEDKRECALINAHPLVSLLTGLEHGDETVTFLTTDGEPFGMGGYIMSAEGPFVWALMTPEMERNAVAVCRYSKEWLTKVLARYGRAHTWASDFNPVHLRWLRWLGFKEDGQRFGPLIHLVIKNVRTQSDYGRGHGRRCRGLRVTAGHRSTDRVGLSGRDGDAQPAAGSAQPQPRDPVVSATGRG